MLPAAPRTGQERYSLGGEMPTCYQFTGQRGFKEIGLQYYGARWYDGALGRFSQADTLIPEDLQGVQAWDRYAYVNNSPVRYNDPTGHCLVVCTAIIGGAIGAIVGAVGYTAYTAVTGNEFDVDTMLLATGGALLPAH